MVSFRWALGHLTGYLGAHGSWSPIPNIAVLNLPQVAIVVTYMNGSPTPVVSGFRPSLWECRDLTSTPRVALIINVPKRERLLILGTIWEFAKTRGPYVEPKQQGSYYKDPHTKDPQLIETAILDGSVGALRVFHIRGQDSSILSQASGRHRAALPMDRSQHCRGDDILSVAVVTMLNKHVSDLTVIVANVGSRHIFGAFRSAYHGLCQLFAFV